jgi:2-polyprenyl-3-methyl-5-hydroxy-6-metoxy-1,4-benzoquinol methylase
MIEKFLANARRLEVGANTNGIILQAEDASEIESGKFDAVLCSYVLHHMAGNLPSVVANLCKALAKGGHICIVEFEPTKRSKEVFASV